MAGRKRKPNAAHKAQGTARKHRHSAQEPKVSGSCLPPPWLRDEYAIEEWLRLVPMLETVGLLAATDSNLVTRYCQAVSDYRIACEEIARDGATQVTQHGLRNHPAWRRKQDAAAEMHRTGSLLGLSPSDRATLGDKGVGTPIADEFENWEKKTPKVVG